MRKKFLWKNVDAYYLRANPSLSCLKVQRLKSVNGLAHEESVFGRGEDLRRGDEENSDICTFSLRSVTISARRSPQLGRSRNSAFRKKKFVTDSQLSVKSISHSISGENADLFKLTVKNGCLGSVFCKYTMISRVTSLKYSLSKNRMRKLPNMKKKKEEKGHWKKIKNTI